MKFKKSVALIIALILSLFIAGCESEEYLESYEVTGRVEKVECDNGGKFRDSSITLDNNVTYTRSDSLACKISQGAMVTIVHNDDLVIKKIIPKDTKRYDNSDKKSKR